MTLKLFNKKTAENDEGSRLAQAAPQGLSVSRLSAVFAIVAVVATAMAGYLAYHQLSAQAEKIDVERQRAEVERAAGVIAGRIQGLQEQLASAAADPALLSAVHAGDTVAQQEALGRLRGRFGSSLSLRLVNPAMRTPDEGLQPALGYACLDLARQVKGGGGTVEVHRFGSEEQHIDLMQPIYEGEQVLTTLQLTLDVALLDDWLKPLLEDGHLELRQGGLLLASQGASELQGLEPLQRIDIPGSAWQLHYRNLSEGLLPKSERLELMAIFAGLAVVLFVIFTVFSWLLGRYVHADLVKLAKYFISVMKRERLHSLSMRLTEFQTAVTALDSYVNAHSPQEPAQTSSRQPEDIDTGEAPPMEAEELMGADLADVMFLDGEGMSMEEVEYSGTGQEQTDADAPKHRS